jgi:hypothetical protein
MKFSKNSHFLIFLGLLFSLFFSSAGLAMIFRWASFTTFNCQRIDSNRGNCELKTVTGPFNKENIRTFPVKELKSASLKKRSTSTSPSSKKTYYVSLKTATKDIYLGTYAYGATGTRASLVTEINNFIKNPKETSLNVKEDDRRLEMYVFAGVFLSIPNLIAMYALKLGIQQLRKNESA